MDKIVKPVKKKILIVEDEKDLRDLYIEIFNEEGFDVSSAADGEEGYSAMYGGGYDLVLLDIMLPKMDGFQILEKLKDQPQKNPNNAIVMLTNLAQDLNISKGISYGVKGYLVKSDYTPEQILKEVKNYLK